MHRPNTPCQYSFSQRWPLVYAALVSALLLPLAACSGTNGNGDGPIPTGGFGEECRGSQVSSVDEQINSVTTSLSGISDLVGGIGILGDIQKGVNDAREVVGKHAETVCQQADKGDLAVAEYERYKACLENAIAAAEEMESQLKMPNSLGAANQAAWALQADAYSIVENAKCERPSEQEAAAMVAQADGGTGQSGAASGTKERGVKMKQKGAMTLVAADDANMAPKTVSLEGYLLCQRRQADGSYVDVPQCNRSTLTEGDRIKFGFKTSQDARVYLFLYNDTGQFQMIFPAPGIDNEAIGGEKYFLPPDSWLELDDVSGVTEYIHLVAAAHKVAELEKLRGADVPPNQQREVQLATRGKLEGFMRRGVKQPTKTITLQAGAQNVTTAPVNVEDLDVVGVEFEIRHE